MLEQARNIKPKIQQSNTILEVNNHRKEIKESGIVIKKQDTTNNGNVHEYIIKTASTYQMKSSDTAYDTSSDRQQPTNKMWNNSDITKHGSTIKCKWQTLKRIM